MIITVGLVNVHRLIEIQNKQNKLFTCVENSLRKFHIQTYSSANFICYVAYYITST